LPRRSGNTSFPRSRRSEAGWRVELAYDTTVTGARYFSGRGQTCAEALGSALRHFFAVGPEQSPKVTQFVSRAFEAVGLPTMGPP
jgi:hypothetical protein